MLYIYAQQRWLILSLGSIYANYYSLEIEMVPCGCAFSDSCSFFDLHVFRWRGANLKWEAGRRLSSFLWSWAYRFRRECWSTIQRRATTCRTKRFTWNKWQVPVLCLSSFRCTPICRPCGLSLQNCLRNKCSFNAFCLDHNIENIV